MNGRRLISDASAGGDVDELIQQWTRDPADVRDRRLILMRTAHLLMAPGIVALLALFLRHRPCCSATRSCGVRISIDDFGTGFSSLTHLRRLLIHEIKIDRSFVAGMLVNENDYIIARAIIDLAHNLGHRVVDEKRVVELLKGLGCDVGQGYFFAKAAPLADVTEWLGEAWPDRMTAHGHPRRSIPRDRV
jgi:predicted signal transduction protein with EAL and GGDEF domain